MFKEFLKKHGYMILTIIGVTIFFNLLDNSEKVMADPILLNIGIFLGLFTVAASIYIIYKKKND